MTDVIDRRPTWLASRLALALVAITVLATGVAIGIPFATVVALVGAVGVVRTARTLATDRSSMSRSDRAGSSISFVVSSVLVIAPVLWINPIDAVLLYCPLFGVLFVGLAGSNAISGPHTGAFYSVCWRSRDVFFTAGIVFGAIQSGAVIAALRFGVMVTTLNTGFVASILLLEVLLYLTITLLPEAQHELGDRVATERATKVATVTVGGNSVEDTLRVVREWIHSHVVLVVVQFIGIILIAPFIERLLLGMGLIGAAIPAIITSGIVHLPLLVVVVLAGLVVGTAFIHELLINQTKLNPPAMAVDSTGPIVVAAGVGLASLAVPDLLSNALFVNRATAMADLYGPAAILFAILSVMMLFIPILITFTSMAATWTGLASSRTSGFLVGAGFVLLGAIIGAEQGLPAVLVFVAVAIAILAWELGEQASYLGVMIGNSGVSDDVETVHATAAIGVGVVSVVLGSGIGYVIGPLPTANSQALFGIVLALLAAVLLLATVE